MKWRTWVAAAAFTMAAAGCGSGDSDNAEALRGDLEAARADARAAEAERDRLAAQVEDLQRQLDEFGGATGSEATSDTEPSPAPTTSPETTAPQTTLPEATVPATTAPPTGDPAAPDASPYVAAFGDIGVVALPTGDPGALSVIAAASELDRSRSLPIIVRNNTADTIGQIDVTGIARDGAGTLAGSGSSQGLEPARVEPGEIAWGYVFFGDVTGDGLTFELSANGDEPNTYFVPVEITELNAAGDQIVGVLTNNTDGEVSGPISVGGVCFSAEGALLGTTRAFAEQSELAPGGIGSFSINLRGDPCPIGLLGASGYEG